MITFNLLHFQPVGFQVLISQPNLKIGLVFLHGVGNNEHKRTTAIYEKKKTRKHAKRPFWKKYAKTR